MILAKKPALNWGRPVAATLLLTLASGCETYKVVDETVAGFVAGAEYTPPDALAKQLEEARKLAEEAAKQAEELAKLAEEAKAAEQAAKAAEEAAKTAEAAAMEQIEAMELAEMKADIAAALEDLKAEKQKQDDIDALIAALEAKEEEIIAEYEAKEDAILAEYETKEAEIIARYEEKAQQPTRVSVKVYAGDDANRNADGEASPVSVRLVALTSEHQLMGTDYFTLQDDLPGALGATFVKELSEVSAEPGQFVSTGELEVPRTTQKIGVIASFADVDRAIWRDNIAVQDRGDEVALLVALDETAVRIIREGEKPEATVIPATFTETLPDELLADDIPAQDDLIPPGIDPFEPNLFNEDDLRPAAPAPAPDDAPLAVEAGETSEDASAMPDDTFEILEIPEELEDTPAPRAKPDTTTEPEIFYDVDAGNLVFLDGITRMDSRAMLDPDAGVGSVNTRLLMRDPAAVEGFDIRTLSPFMPIQDFWGTKAPLFAFLPIS